MVRSSAPASSTARIPTGCFRESLRRMPLVEVQGVTEDGSWTFPLPRLGVQIDLRTGSLTRTMVLAPQILVLLPEESRCHLVYRG